ncbi:MAG TPA: DUF488 domain-containing protein [Thermoanaerobaculia bacterium]|jgi:uncharacterized protein (DUF488 family)
MLNRIYTIGHSTRTLAELVALLRDHGVTRLADIRRFPGSKRHPHFTRESLESTLPRRTEIAYEHFEDLGGRRRPAKNSPNGAWESESFRGYADHMLTPAFQAAIEKLLASDTPTAVMCAESVPWRCHRNLLSDDLVRRGIEVIHILGPGSSHPHVLNEMAKIDGDRVIYPPSQGRMF